jgi:RND family efflux transporter MFP subunit
MSNPEKIAPPGRLSVGFRVFIGLVLVAIAVAIAYVVTTGIASRLKAATSLKLQTVDMAVPTVTVIHPKRTSVAEEVVLPGNAQAYIATPIYARTNGYLKSWSSDIGARVKAGQLLAEIETPEVDRQLDQARADLSTARANMDLSQTTATRYQTLFKSDSVSKQEVEDKVGDLQAKKAMVDSAAFNVRRLEETQKFQNVYAPFVGVITARNVDIGALINAGANAPGKELFDIASTSQLRVYVNVPQSYSRDIRPGGTAELTLAELAGRRFAGKIMRTADSIDPTSRTLLTEVDVDNPRGELMPGAFFSVHFKLGSKVGAVIVPVNALIFRSEGMRVAVVRDNKAELVNITIGRDYGTEVEVLSGITAQDEIIENPSDSLTSGTEVRPAKAAEK